MSRLLWDYPENKFKRIVFNEITKTAVQGALETPRKVDHSLVNSQQARRILDRVVGYEMSPILWKKLKRGLSAGRVQSVAVRIIVEKENEINAFEISHTFKASAEFESKGQSFEADLNHEFESAEDVKAIFKWFK